MYVQLSVEHSVDAAQRVYCPHKDCSVTLIRPAAPEGREEEEEAVCSGPSECPSCHRPFCLHCLSPGWHEVRGQKGCRVGGIGLGFRASMRYAIRGTGAVGQ